MTRIQFNCGCTFSTVVLEEAERHANQDGHIMHVSGEVRPEKKTLMDTLQSAPVASQSAEGGGT